MIRKPGHWSKRIAKVLASSILLVFYSSTCSADQNPDDVRLMVKKVPDRQLVVTEHIASLNNGDCSESKFYVEDKTKSVRLPIQVDCVLLQNKYKLERLLLRAMRKSPDTAGEIRIELTILPSGEVSQIHALGDERIDAKIIQRISAVIKSLSWPENLKVDVWQGRHLLHFGVEESR